MNQSLKNIRGCCVFGPGKLPHKNRSLKEDTLNSGFDLRTTHASPVIPREATDVGFIYYLFQKRLIYKGSGEGCTKLPFGIWGVRHLSFMCVPVRKLRWAAGSQLPWPDLSAQSLLRWLTEVMCHLVFQSCLLLALSPSVDSTRLTWNLCTGTRCASEWVYGQELVKGRILPLQR